MDKVVEINRLHSIIAAMAREHGISHAQVLNRLVDRAIAVERGLEPRAGEPGVEEEVCRNLGVSLNEYQTRADNPLSLNQREYLELNSQPGRYTPRMEEPDDRRTDVRAPARGDSIADPIGAPRMFEEQPEPAWQDGWEEPATSGVDEFSGVEPKRESVYLRKKFQFNGGRGHFAGFRNA